MTTILLEIIIGTVIVNIILLGLMIFSKRGHCGKISMFINGVVIFLSLFLVIFYVRLSKMESLLIDLPITYEYSCEFLLVLINVLMFSITNTVYMGKVRGYDLVRTQIIKDKENLDKNVNKLKKKLRTIENNVRIEEKEVGSN